MYHGSRSDIDHTEPQEPTDHIENYHTFLNNHNSVQSPHPCMSITQIFN